METKPEYVDVKSITPLITERATKKRIEEFAGQQVGEQWDTGFMDPVQEIVVATKLAAYFTARVSALRHFALLELKGEKRRSSLGASVEQTTNAGRWEHEDPYMEQLKEELKFVEEKAKHADPAQRSHVTLLGEVITIQRSRKIEGGENVKVLL